MKENLWSIVMVEMTSHCNFSCEFCPSDAMNRPKTMMSRELWQKVIREVGEKKLAKTIFFHLMGEPLLHKDIFSAISFANSFGLSVSLYTNGALLDEGIQEKLLSSLNIGRVVLSLQDISPEKFAKRCHGVLSWDEYLSRLISFTKKAELQGKNVQVHCLADVRSMGWSIRKLKEENRRIQEVYNMWLKALGKSQKYRINVLDPAVVYPLGESSSFYVKHKGLWDNQFIQEGMKVIPSDRGHCALMTDTFSVLADGSCTFCCCDYEGALNLGDARVNSIEDIYYGEKASKIRKSGENGEMIESRCKICRGRLVYKRTGKPVPMRNILSEYFFFKDHLKRYGIRSAFQKVKENITKRIGIIKHE